MGRRSRKIVKLPKKKLPKVFQCPICNEVSINIHIEKNQKLATVKCGKCGIESHISIIPADQLVDIYCKFTDALSVKDETHE